MPYDKSGRDAKRGAVRTAPNNYEAEQSLLGAMLLDTQAANDALMTVGRDDFYYESHAIIFDVICELMSANQPIDVITLSDKLMLKDQLSKVGGIQYINTLLNILPSAANMSYYLDIVKRDGKLRKIIRNAERIIANTYEQDDETKALAYAEKMIYDISEEGEKSNLEHVGEAATEVMRKFEEITKNPDGSYGLLTYYKNLDSITNGYQGGQLIVLAARPGCGKTTFALNVAGNIARHAPEKKIAVFNLEMNRYEVVQRLLVSIAHVPMKKILDARATKTEFDKLWEANKLLSKSNIFIDDTAQVTPEQIMSKCRRLAQRKGGLDLVIIDYLQLMESSIRRDSKQQEVSEISRSMKLMAKELNVPVILLSQMSRSIEKREDKTPMLSDLRESGAIEQDADQVYFLSRNEATDDEVENKIVDLVIAKHRSGPTGTVHFKYENEMLLFVQAKKYEKFVKAKVEEDDSVTVEFKDESDDYVVPTEELTPPPEDADGVFYTDGTAVYDVDFQNLVTSIQKSMPDLVPPPEEGLE